MLDALAGPWPWFVSGPLIGLMVPLLLLAAGKPLGISGSFQSLCDLARPRKMGSAGSGFPASSASRLGKEGWKLVFGVGILMGGFAAVHWLSSSPSALFPEGFRTAAGVLQLMLGGFLVGFGSRYAGGCTSGHAIFGLSSFQPASLVAVLGFFAGGLGAAGITLLIG